MIVPNLERSTRAVRILIAGVLPFLLLSSCSTGTHILPPWFITADESSQKLDPLTATDNFPAASALPCLHDSGTVPTLSTDLATLRALPAPLSSVEDDFGSSYIRTPGGEEFMLVSSVRGSLQALFTTAPGGKFFPVKTKLRKWNVGMAAVASDGRTIFFSARPPAGTLDEGDLFTGELVRTEKSAEIKNIHALATLNSPFWDAQPTLTRDGRTIYFASNRPGGKGGTDIWMAEKKTDGAWGTPYPLETLNTPCDELTPFIADDNTTLYFSSNTHISSGGYDVFFSHRSGEECGAPENMGLPVNSQFDELSPCLTQTASGDTLFFFSSNRPQTESIKHDFDLYVFSTSTKALYVEKNILLAPSATMRVEGVVTNEEKNELSRAEIFWYEQNNSAALKTLAASEDGSYSLELVRGRTYTIGAQGGNYFFDSYTFTVPMDTSVRMIRYDFRVRDSLTLRINFPNDEAETPYEFTLDDDGAPTLQRWQEALDLLVANVKKYQSKIRQLVLTGHSSASGSDEYNYALSLRRTRFIKAELVRRGINAAMIATRSEGKNLLLPRNRGEDAKTWAARCRRVVLSKIVWLRV